MFNLDRPVHENESWNMFWPIVPRPICPGHGDQDHDQRISLELDVSRGGGGGGGGGQGPGETLQGHFSGQNR